MNSAYIFNTESLQRELNPGKYIIDYSLAFDKNQMGNVLKQYDWLKDNSDSIWLGKIEINNIEIELK